MFPSDPKGRVSNEVLVPQGPQWLEVALHASNDCLSENSFK